MAYYDDEASVADGAPTELYDFTAPATSYRYTSAAAAVTYGGNSYTPAPGLRRSAVGAGTTQANASLTVAMRSAESLIQAFGFGSPPRSLRLRVYRQQATSGETVTIWDGVVVAITSRGAMAELRSTSQVGLRLATQVPALAVQGRCQHFLYDARCKVDRTAYQHTTTVASFTSNTITLTSDGGNPDGWFANGGEIERVTDGERRSIYDHTGNVVTLSSPFVTIANGDSVRVWPGCDHQHRIRSDGFPATLTADGHCLNKFNNVVNFGGHPTVPGSNPFALGVHLVKLGRG